ncbi:MAG: DUF1987 domain-containing protein [Rhodospirillaceae bacterium]
MTEAPIKIKAKEPLPEIHFDFQANRFAIRGTCYPENVRSFFGDITDKLERHLQALNGATVAFELELSYFNSSATRVFYTMFEALEACAAAGNQVTVTWLHAPGDENMVELAEEFEEDFDAAKFVIKPSAA